MTDLQLGLALLGAVAVVGVLAYNRLQERGVRKRVERAFQAPRGDALLDEPHGRREPTLDLPPRPPQLDGAAMPDERADYIMALALPRAAAGAVLLELWAPLEQRFARRVLLAGTDGAGWRRLAAGENGTFRELRAALQLVSRAGVVGDAELLEFRSLVETLAASLGASVSAPGMREALEAARALDHACAEADIQVALHVVGVRPAEIAPLHEPPFQITPREDGVTLTLDVPRTVDPARSYEAMARAGLELATAHGGRLVDDNGAALDERALAAIGAQLAAVRGLLAGRGIEPGSALALRLFS